MPILRKHEPGVCVHVRALRKATKRGIVTRARSALRAQSTRPGGAGRPPGNVPEVPQILSAGKQILRILWYPSTGNGTPDGTAAGADATACGPPARRAAAAPRGSTATACRPARAATPPRGSTAVSGPTGRGPTDAHP